MNDLEAMARAINLAWRGWGRVESNPMVGAVVLRDGAVIAEGWHAEFGGPHAEIVALEQAGPLARGAALVVSLEPCAHHGKTPPCAEAIARAGIRRVVFGAEDQDPKARGGAGVLKDAGVVVEGGLDAAHVRAQNAAFFRQHEGPDRPFVAVKLAVSLDGRIADKGGSSKWISGEEARAWVHWLRAGFDAIGVGVGTVKADDPQLTVRGDIVPRRPPLRVVFDLGAETPESATVVRTARETPTLVLAGTRADPARVAALDRAGVDVAIASDFTTLLRLVRGRGVASLLVEGGSKLAGRLVEAGLVDRFYVITAPLALGTEAVPALDIAGGPLAKVQRWRTVGRKALGDDTLIVLDR